MSREDLKSGYARYAFETNKDIDIQIMYPLRSIGMYIVDKGWENVPQIIDFIELFWVVSGSSTFVIEGKEYIVTPGQVCFYFPGDNHLQYCKQNDTKFYWLCISGKYVSNLIEAYNIKRQPYYAGKCPTNLFDQLGQDIWDDSIESLYMNSAHAFEILNTALLARHHAPSTTDMLHKFRMQLRLNFNKKECTTEYLADLLGIHRATLHRLIKQGTGKPPSEHITDTRINFAMQLLNNTSFTVKRIAEDCGYATLGYFAKVFFRHTSMSPTEFRRKK